jgi:predicted PurR-regulated permease PerM
MESNNIAKGILIAGYKLLLFFIGIYLIIALNELIIHLAIAGVLALIGRPIVLFIERKLKFSSLLAATITLFFFAGIIIGMISLFVPLISKQGDNLSLLNVEELENKFFILSSQINEFIGWNNSILDKNTISSNMFSNIGFSSIPDILNGVIGTLSNFTIGLFSIIFASFFFLKDSKILEKTILIFISDDYESKFIIAFENIKNLLSRYFIGLVFQITILLIIYTFVLLMFGIPNAFIIALLCSLLNLIPYLGPIIGAFLISALTMTSFIDASFTEVVLPKTLYVLLGFSFGQIIDNFFSQPYIFSKSVKSHPLEIFIIIIIAGTLFGTIGLIVAIPAYTSIKVIFKIFFKENEIVKSLTKNL